MGAPGAADDAELLRSLATTGYGHFTTMLVDDGRVRGLARHLARLERDCAALFGTALDVADVRARLRAAVPPTGRVVARVTVADPGLGLATLGAPAAPRPVVTLRPAPDGPPAALRVRTVEHRRYLPEVKSAGLFPLLHLRRLAVRDGLDDVLLTAGGRLLEGSTWNLGLVTGDRVVWPDGPVLAGVTRALLLGAGVGGPGVAVGTADLPAFDAAFAVSAAGIRAVAAIDGHAFDPAHPVLAGVARTHAALPADPIHPG